MKLAEVLGGIEMNILDEIRGNLERRIAPAIPKELPTKIQAALQKRKQLEEFYSNIANEPLAQLGLQTVKGIKTAKPEMPNAQAEYSRPKNEITQLPEGKYAAGFNTANVLPHELKHAGIQALLTPGDDDPYWMMYRNPKDPRITNSNFEEERVISQGGNDKGYDVSYPDIRNPNNANYDDPTHARWLGAGLDDMAWRALNAKGLAPDWVPSNILPNSPISSALESNDNSQSIYLRQAQNFRRDMREIGAEKSLFIPDAKTNDLSPYLPGIYKKEDADIRQPNRLRIAILSRLKGEIK